MTARFDAARRRLMRWWTSQGLPVRAGALVAAGVSLGLLLGAALLLARSGDEGESAVVAVRTVTPVSTPTPTPSPTSTVTPTTTPTPTPEPTPEGPPTVSTIQELAERYGEPPDATPRALPHPLAERRRSARDAIRGRRRRDDAEPHRSRRRGVVRPLSVGRPRRRSRRGRERDLLRARGLRRVRRLRWRAVPRPRRLLSTSTCSPPATLSRLR